MNLYLVTMASLALSAGMILGPAPASAQLPEQEPNNSCSVAQPVGGITGLLPLLVSGSLDTDLSSYPPAYDVDFFRFEAIAGLPLHIELRGAGSGVGTLEDPFLGVFDATCNLLAANDDSAFGLESRIAFEVPGDGVFIVAATGCCDPEFTGVHFQEGSYELGLLEAPPAIGSIYGRVVDASNGEPLPGDNQPYAFAELFRCNDTDCSNYAAFVPVGGDGTFRVTTDIDGIALAPGTYLVAARADGYQLSGTQPFAVGEGEDYEVGDMALDPPPVVFANVMPCEGIPSHGGICQYTLEVRNNTRTAIRGLGWSLVQASGTGSLLGYSVFPAEKDRLVRIPAGGSRVLRFSFRVPTDVADGAFFCTEAWFSDHETAFMGTVRTEQLFCTEKQSGVFSTLSPKVAAGLLKSHGGRLRKAAQ